MVQKKQAAAPPVFMTICEAHLSDNFGERIRLLISSAGRPILKSIPSPWNPSWPGPWPPIGGETIAASRTTRVSRVPIQGYPWPIYVKVYRYPRFRDRLKGTFRTTCLARSRAFREWRSLQSLRAAGIPGVTELILTERRRMGWLVESVLVTAGVEPNSTLADLMDPDASPAVKASEHGAIAVELGRTVSRLHDSGFAAGRFRFRNILTSRDSMSRWSFRLIDLPHGRFGRKASVTARVGDLADLDLSARRVASRSARLRFVLAYAPELAARPVALRHFLTRVEQATGRRRARMDERL